MPSVSKAQQRFMGMVHAAQKGDLEHPSKEVEKAADSMSDKAAKDFASTKHKGLPNHVKKENKMDLEDEDLPSAVVPGVSAENTKKSKHLKWQNEQIEIIINENLDEGFLKNSVLAAMLMISAIGGGAGIGANYMNHSIERQLKAGNAVELVMKDIVFNGNKLKKDKYILTVNPKQTQPIKIDTSKSTITINTSDIDNIRLKNAIETQMYKIDPSLSNREIVNGAKDAAGKISYGVHTGLSIGQNGLQLPGHFGFGIDVTESINEESHMDKMIRAAADKKPEAIYYVFYKGQFEVTYAGTFGINTDYYWDKFKVRKPKGSQFKLNPEFIIVSKKTYDAHPNNYSKLKPYVDKYWKELGESADANQNAAIASIEDLPNNRTHKKFPLPTNEILWNATGKVCEGRPVVERIKMYEKKGGGWREGIQRDEQIFNSIKELYSERVKTEIKESIKKKFIQKLS